MGQTPPKYFVPSAPYGGSQATNVLNAAQPPSTNPQTPLLPPGFTDPGTQVKAAAAAAGTPNAPGNTMMPGGNPLNPANRQGPRAFDPQRMYGQ